MADRPRTRPSVARGREGTGTNAQLGIRVLLAESQGPVREALSGLIEQEDGLELVGAAADADDALARIREARPDVVLLDVEIPDEGGARVAAEVRESMPEVRVIALSADADRDRAREMLRSGVVAYLVKGTAPAEIFDAIARAMRGQASLPDEVLHVVTDERARQGHVARAAERERQRLAGHIHDDPIQSITASSMRLQILRRRLRDPEELALLDELDESIRQSIDGLRALIAELRPPELDRDGLAAALRRHLIEPEDETPTRFRLEDELVAEPSEETRLILYRIAQEAIANVREHARARAATVSLSQSGGGYLVRVRDDGVGFAPERLVSTPGRIGLASMRERAELAGGWLRVSSEAGAGTNVEFWIPERR